MILGKPHGITIKDTNEIISGRSLFPNTNVLEQKTTWFMKLIRTTTYLLVGYFFITETFQNYNDQTY